VVFKDAAYSKVVQYVRSCPCLSRRCWPLNVGQRVKVRCKVLSKGERRSQAAGVCGCTMQPLGAAPLTVFTEIKPTARTNRLTAADHAGRQRCWQILSCGLPKDATSESGGMMLREPEAERRAFGKTCRLLGVKSIDWKTQIVIYVGHANRREFARLNRNQQDRCA